MRIQVLGSWNRVGERARGSGWTLTDRVTVGYGAAWGRPLRARPKGRAMKRLLACLPLVLLTVGCQSARLVSADSQGGCVAIPANSNGWPGHYRDEATKLMRQQCPAGYVIVKEEEVVVGQTSTTHTDREGANQELIKNSGLTLNSERTRQQTQVQNQTEWRIWYRSSPGANGGVEGQVVPAGAVMPAR